LLERLGRSAGCFGHSHGWHPRLGCPSG